MWKQKLTLNEGETLRFESRREKGNLGQEEVELYSVVNVTGHVVGEVQYIDHTSIKAPFRKSFHLLHRKEGKTLLDERWES